MFLLNEDEIRIFFAENLTNIIPAKIGSNLPNTFREKDQWK